MARVIDAPTRSVAAGRTSQDEVDHSANHDQEQHHLKGQVFDVQAP
jgi:hypothetical protein